MKGTLLKIGKDWEVLYSKPRTDNQNGYYLDRLPLHPYNVKEITEWSMVFDNIEGRINSNPEVEFEIVDMVTSDSHSSEMIEYAKLIHKI